MKHTIYPAMVSPTESDITRHDLIPEPTLRRLPWYLAYVSLLRSRKARTVSSTAIARATGVEASQIAKDLSYINVRGKTRIGYDVATLERALRSYLGFDADHHAVMIGVGSLGGALIADSGLKRYGLDIVAGFDIRPEVIGTVIGAAPIFHIERLAEMRRALEADIAVVAVPVESAQEVAGVAVDAGIRAIWNFTPVRLHTPAGIVVQNTSIYSSLAVMYNRLDDALQHPQA